MVRMIAFKPSLPVLFFLIVSGSVFPQTIIWSDNFNNGCAANCIASTYGGWTIQNNIGGTNGGSPNNWFVSCAEEGIVPPGCGSSCIGDASLHIGADPGSGGDMGASFNETGAANATYRRVVSPTISTVGYFNNTLEFDFIAFGSASCSDDRAQLHLSTDNGATWPVGFQYCLTSVCCGACNGYSQGQWTLYTLALPAAFDNNPNVRVAFHWRNNGNGSGTDPSVAIDDARITNTVMPLNLVQFKGRIENGGIKLDWSTTMENQMERFDIEQSNETDGFKVVASVDSKGNTTGSSTLYSHILPGVPQQVMYYRLKMIDKLGNVNYSNVVRMDPNSSSALQLTSFSGVVNKGILNLNMWTVDAMQASLDIYDIKGEKVILSLGNQNLVSGENVRNIDVSALASGVYVVKIRLADVPLGYEPIHLNQKFIVVQ